MSLGTMMAKVKLCGYDACAPSVPARVTYPTWVLTHVSHSCSSVVSPQIMLKSCHFCEEVDVRNVALMLLPAVAKGGAVKPVMWALIWGTTGRMATASSLMGTILVFGEWIGLLFCLDPTKRT